MPDQCAATPPVPLFLFLALRCSWGRTATVTAALRANPRVADAFTGEG
jgi:hypothetical protein